LFSIILISPLSIILDVEETIGFLRDLLRDGPSGIAGRHCGKIVSAIFGAACSLQVEIASSSLREERCFGVDSFEDFVLGMAKGRGTRFDCTYGRLFDSSIDVNKRIAALLCPSVGVEFSSFM
jgi:hypothetical protein